MGAALLDPFPGNILGPRPEWKEANGSGLWIALQLIARFARRR
jgi:hypothetical protein